MQIQLRFFASLRETLGVSSEALELPGHVRSAGDVLVLLRQRGGAWEELLAPGRPFRIAVDQAMAGEASILRDGAELAIFPPVTGG